jgi:hypothetical protein
VTATGYLTVDHLIEVLTQMRADVGRDLPVLVHNRDAPFDTTVIDDIWLSEPDDPEPGEPETAVEFSIGYGVEAWQLTQFRNNQPEE